MTCICGVEIFAVFFTAGVIIGIITAKFFLMQKAGVQEK